MIGGNVQGATVMSETLTQYSALMVMEKEYGKQKMRKFLKYEMDKYLRSRGYEKKKELPLYLNENQAYIAYNKGAVVMYGLRDLIGEDTLNAALRRYIKAVAYQEPPYTNSLEFLSYIKDATPDSLKYYIEDMFENITLYDNKVDSVSYTKLDNGKYKVNLEVEATKYRTDSIGQVIGILKTTTTKSGITIKVGASEEDKDTDKTEKHEEMLYSHKLADWIDIGIFGKKDGEVYELYLKKHKITRSKTYFSIIVDEKPFEVGIDPYNKLIDKNSDDNRKKAKLVKGK